MFLSSKNSRQTRQVKHLKINLAIEKKIEKRKQSRQSSSRHQFSPKKIDFGKKKLIKFQNPLKPPCSN